jgi:stearoyl-CoA desaturase (Delta-9 desaturase)
MIHGLLNLSLAGLIIAGLVMVQITIAGVTIYLHRHQAHRALTLHPIASHFFRFWLWMTTGMVTRDWVAIHRKHHANTDVEGDPHSPVVLGIKKVFFEGAELYRAASKNKDMVTKYSHGTPDDWIENNLYSKYSAKGVVLMLGINLLLFGIPGLTIWAIQMLWIPLHAAGIINGIGHYFGYRNFECLDASTNIIPWAFWIGGEELHNNHHTFASSAKFSVKPWEFDIGWLYIKILAFFGLAEVKKLPPKIKVEHSKVDVDLDTVRALIGNRFQIMTQYYKNVICPIVRKIKSGANFNKNDNELFALLSKEETLLSETARSKMHTLLSRYDNLKTIYHYRQSLQNIWLKTASSQKELVDSLQLWCKQAEESGLDVLHQFSMRIKSYVPSPAV